MFKKRVFTPQELCGAIWLLVDENLDIFTRQGYAQDPLETKVVYRRERPGENEFLNVCDMLKLGWGDCEDLSAWLVAFYLYQGVQARPCLEQQTDRLYHVTLEAFYNGRWNRIDISKMKGM